VYCSALAPCRVFVVVYYSVVACNVDAVCCSALAPSEVLVAVLLQCCCSVAPVRCSALTPSEGFVTVHSNVVSVLLQCVAVHWLL
jgi:hypothetical protein